MTPSQQCKDAGLDSLAHLTRLSPVPERTLCHWFKHKPEWFQMAINDALVKGGRLNNIRQ